MTGHRYTRYGSLQNKVVVITGGASGIGADLVAAFRQQESRVHFLDIDTTAGTALAQERGAHFHPVDVRNIAALREAIDNIAAREGGIDVLINNAARDDRTDTLTVEPEAWRESLAVNLDHQFFASQAVAAVMQKGKGGNIILTSSTSFMKGRPGMSGYTTSKAAIVGLSQTLRRWRANWGHRVFVSTASCRGRLPRHDSRRCGVPRRPKRRSRPCSRSILPSKAGTLPPWRCLLPLMMRVVAQARSFLSMPVSVWCEPLFMPARSPHERAGCAGAS